MEMEKVARSACRILKVSMSDLIRSGIEKRLAEMMPQCMAIAENEQRSGATRIKMVKFLDRVVEGSLALHAPKKVVEALRGIERK